MKHGIFIEQREHFEEAYCWFVNRTLEAEYNLKRKNYNFS